MATNLTNASFEAVPTFVAAQTGDGWINGTATGSSTDATSGWWASPRATGIAVRFDPTLARTGSASLKLSTTDVTGRARVYNVPASSGNVVSASHANFIAVLPSSTYTLTAYAQTNNVAAASVFTELVEVNSSFGIGASTASNTLTGTNSTWQLLTATVTTGTSTSFLAVDMQNATAGNISDAWFDDLFLTGPGIVNGTIVTHYLTLLGVGK